MTASQWWGQCEDQAAGLPPEEDLAEGGQGADCGGEAGLAGGSLQMLALSVSACLVGAEEYRYVRRNLNMIHTGACSAFDWHCTELKYI